MFIGVTQTFFNNDNIQNTPELRYTSYKYKINNDIMNYDFLLKNQTKEEMINLYNCGHNVCENEKTN
jgi:archaellum component FlaF (FlaF/FlaG flagellin family)